MRAALHQRTKGILIMSRGARCFVVVMLIGSSLLPGAWGKLDGVDGAVISVLSSGDVNSGRVATELAANGDSVVHVIAGSMEEVAKINQQIDKAGLKGIVTVEDLSLKALPYRDRMISTLLIMDVAKATEAGLTMEEARRCVAPFGKLVTCKNGAIEKVEEIAVPEGMDVWRHKYYKANGLPASQDQHFKLPVGFKWNAGLPNNFDNPERGANRYASTRAIVVDDGRIFTFSEGVYENLGEGYKAKFGTDQYLNCRDAFNGRLLWRKRIGATYYGGLYVENVAPMISTGRHIYLAGEKGKMLKIDTRTGETLKELPTAHIPGVIAADDGIVVVATWKDGYHMGSVRNWDRRRMDWKIGAGTIEAYDDETGKQLWKQDHLGTSLLLEGGRVFIVTRKEKDGLEYFRRKPNEKQLADLKARLEKGEVKDEEKGAPTSYTRPQNYVMAFDLKTGEPLWQTDVKESKKLAGQTLNLEAAAKGAVAVAQGNRNQVELLSAKTGLPLSPEQSVTVKDTFFRFRQHVCTPVFRVNDISLNHRGGKLGDFGGARAACLTGTVPAYGAGFISQNWCNCTPGQIKGLIAIASIGKTPTPEEMEQPAEPVTYGSYDEKADGPSRDLKWTTFRGNAIRSSSVDCEINPEATEAWSVKVVAGCKEGTVLRDWHDYLNSRLTAPVISDKVAIVADIDQNELIALNLQDGKVAWRFMTAGRMNTSPTLYKGICLAGDHAGYVYALKVKNGELIYKLRIAPEEKRMLSYGKLESVWPIVGGVLVNDGKAYAACGRTIGSDGGVMVRAFQPETGTPIWANSKLSGGKGKRNDALVLECGALRLMDKYLDAETGELLKNPREALIAKAMEAKVKELNIPMPKGGELNKLKNEVTKGLDLPKPLRIGNEGIYSWNWRHLGFRKFGSLSYDGGGITAVAWAEQGKAFSQGRGAVTWAPYGQGKKGCGIQHPAEYQTTSIILCNNSIVYGGEIIEKGEKKGYIRIVDCNEGKLTWENTYDAQLAFNGLAVEQGMIVASFDDGSVVMLK